MPAPIRFYILLHVIVFIFGFTAILGKLITLPSDLLVWYRVLIGLGGIAVLLLVRKTKLFTGFSQVRIYLLVGLLIAAHWVTFFESVKQANVSVALAAISSATLFTSFLEPLFFKRNIRLYEITFGLLIVLGLYLIFRFETTYSYGLMLGVVSAFLASSFTVINGKLVQQNKSSVISFYELLGALGGLTLYVFLISSYSFSDLTLSLSDVGWLLLLGLVCTTFAFVASVEVMKALSPFTVSLTINLEPVYGILVAFFLFGDSEKMSSGFYAGALIILFTLFANAWLKRKNA